jgi:hypothetical protein
MTAFVRHLRGEFGRRLATQDLFEPRLLLARALRAAALPPALVAADMSGFPDGDSHEKPPQVIAAAQVREPALLSMAAEQVEGAESHVFLVGHATRRALEPLTCQSHEAREVTLPKRLHGGAGNDRLDGGSGDDIVISGTSDHNANDAALRTVMAEWTRTDQTYAQRHTHLRLGGGLNGTVRLNTTTVRDSGTDSLTGGSDQDWFFALGDVLTDRVSGERVN